MTYRIFKQYYPHILAACFTVLWCVLAINPLMRDVWLAENLPIVGVFLLLVASFKKFRFSNTAYTLMSVWLILHTIGGHYTFAKVPFDFFTDMFDLERNHFDRIAHFSIGFYAYPIAELVTRKKQATPIVTYLFSLFGIMSLAAGYEIIEWWYAVLEGGDAGIEFLGSQGDIWDAQKDMLADTLGAVASLALFRWHNNTN
ncbi:MAG: hypothetical protein CL942_04545 [Desulfovibrio sp.]|nr:hypothetical protein [Desulfovibrio sp.]|tara:strand:- start:621 stop:1220 length:600 start_codon:yes stop_codon:yes gene_type:complete